MMSDFLLVFIVVPSLLFFSIDVDPPKIKCPDLKDKWAEPGKLTARVTWDTPEGVDTADGILTESVLPSFFFQS